MKNVSGYSESPEERTRNASCFMTYGAARRMMSRDPSPFMTQEIARQATPRSKSSLGLKLK
jgi:hypothetical protein